jgi:hypothetical protein
MDDYVIKLVTCNGEKIQTIIDQEDEPLFDQTTWTASDNGSGRIYVCRTIWHGKGKKQDKVYWHTLITNPPSGKIVDHINGNSLDNRKLNLRAVTWKQNSMNRAANRTHKGRPTTSPYKGVSWDKRRNRWVSSIGHNYKPIPLGYFRMAEDAARVYDAKAKELFGEFAYQNFPRLDAGSLDI